MDLSNKKDKSKESLSSENSSERKCLVLVEKNEDHYEISQKAFSVFSSFKNKRIAIMRVSGENSLELSNIFTGCNAFGDLVRKKSLRKETIEQEYSKIFFYYTELQDNSILIILYNSNEKDNKLKVITTLLSSCIIYNLEGMDFKEEKIIKDINFLPYTVMEHKVEDNKYQEENLLDFEVEEIFPHITFLTHEEEVPIFKSHVSSFLHIVSFFSVYNQTFCSLYS